MRAHDTLQGAKPWEPSRDVSLIPPEDRYDWAAAMLDTSRREHVLMQLWRAVGLTYSGEGR